jgi:hypothetical protein
LDLDKSQHTLNQRSWFEKFTKANKISFLSNNSELSQDKILKLYSIYDKVIINSQKLAQIQLNSQLILITKQPQYWLVEMQNFAF